MQKSFTSRGFTLIELLVVIAIIGILSSVVLASLSTARAKSRDARRIADIGQVRTALEVYFDSASTYPASPNVAAVSASFDGNSSISSSIGLLVASGTIAKLPSDPLSSGNYHYLYCAFASKPTSPATACSTSATGNTYYVLAATLERGDNAALKTDTDVDANHSNINSAGTISCRSATAGQEQCYDITN
jgi:prepilin-type N-terminal cleavage/methylation domain-containing protein